MPATASEGLGVDSGCRGRAISGAPGGSGSLQWPQRGGSHPEDSNLPPLGFRRATTTSAGTRALRCATMAHPTTRDGKGRRPTRFAFSPGKRPQSPGKSGRMIRRRTMGKYLEITLFQVQGPTTENRGVPSSSPTVPEAITDCLAHLFFTCVLAAPACTRLGSASSARSLEGSRTSHLFRPRERPV
jgi:hypothetical protein